MRSVDNISKVMASKIRQISVTHSTSTKLVSAHSIAPDVRDAEAETIHASLPSTISTEPKGIDFSRGARSEVLLLTQGHVDDLRTISNALTKAATYIIDSWWTKDGAGTMGIMPLCEKEEEILKVL